MGILDSLITRRSVLIGAGSVAGTVGLAGVADAAPHRRSASLTPKQQAGQRVIFSYPGETVPDTLLDQISAGEVGGVIFFGENITGLDQIASVTQQLKDAHAKSPVSAPLLLMTDQEGGIVRRLPGDPVQNAREVGSATYPVPAAADAGTGAERNLAGVGMNHNLAPVLDVYRESGNFDDQFGRSFSKNPQTCGRCGAAFTTAQQRPGRVLATAKHFPGLGAATRAQNTDLGPVRLDVPLAQLRRKDELPFRNAITAGVRLVMTSWAVYPALDPELPAGLSPEIVQRELRGRLGFQGVTITDALEAGALTEFGTAAQSGVRAAGAGMDILLCSARDVDQGASTTEALADAVQHDELDSEQFQTALQRVLQLRRNLS
jgi:beta-N-acetylhexosaminidase